MKKTKHEARQTRRQLLDAALEVFYREGVAHASLQQIAAEAGLTRGALYWHFRNKEDLFAALFEDWFADIESGLAAPPDAACPWQQLAGCLNDILQRIENDRRHRQFCAVLHFKCEHTERNAVFTELSERYIRLIRQRIETMLQNCFRQPENGAAHTALLHLESVLVGLVRLWLAQPQRFGLSEEGGKITAALIRGLQNGG